MRKRVQLQSEDSIKSDLKKQYKILTNINKTAIHLSRALSEMSNLIGYSELDRLTQLTSAITKTEAKNSALQFQLDHVEEALGELYESIDEDPRSQEESSTEGNQYSSYKDTLIQLVHHVDICRSYLDENTNASNTYQEAINQRMSDISTSIEMVTPKRARVEEEQGESNVFSMR